jgi:hypothetical protein
VAKVLIVTDPGDRYLLRFALLRTLGLRWMKSGHHVTSHAGSERLPDADLAFLHVDLSVVPPAYPAAMEKFPATVNRGVTDRRKRAYSTLLVGRGDGYDGPVIVKTDLNSGGMPERIREEKAKGRLRGSDRQPATGFRQDYLVYDSVGDVPAQVWSDPALVVEKFIHHVRDGKYCVQYYYFLGDAEFSVAVYSHSRVVKTTAALGVEQVPVPENLRALRRKMGFGYGKFDYVLQGSDGVLFDANPTPADTLLTRFGLIEEAARRLAAGLESLLARSS